MAFLETPCPAGKVQYAEKIEALLALVHWQLQGNGDKRPIRVYPCDLCGAWHLTSQELKNKDETQWV